MVEPAMIDPFKRTWWMPGWGEIALSSLIWALVSGMLLVPGFNAHHDPFQSVSRLISVDAFGYFLHSFHSYSGDIFLIAAFVHTIEYLIKRTHRSYLFKQWFYLILLMIVSILAVFSGFLSIGSKESASALHIFDGILQTVPVIGGQLSLFFIQLTRNINPFSVIYLHHAATFTILTVILTYVHIKRLKAERYALLYTGFLLALLALILPASLGHPADAVVSVVKGPWYFIGLQEMLSWMPVFVAGIAFPLIIIGLLAWLPQLKSKDRPVLYAIAVLLIFYLMESVIGWFLRGEGWQIFGR
ncbi:MAG: hypothetical protein GF313_14700 [Caldithrix sp.]|nr:hypothetical protein [Caldithrix sp.]